MMSGPRILLTVFSSGAKTCVSLPSWKLSSIAATVTSCGMFQLASAKVISVADRPLTVTCSLNSASPSSVVRRLDRVDLDGDGLARRRRLGQHHRVLVGVAAFEHVGRAVALRDDDHRGVVVVDVDGGVLDEQVVVAVLDVLVRGLDACRCTATALPLRMKVSVLPVIV